MPDLTQKCKECGKDFVLEEDEQKWFKEHRTSDGQLMTLPKRCKECRQRRKMEDRRPAGGYQTGGADGSPK